MHIIHRRTSRKTCPSYNKHKTAKPWFNHLLWQPARERSGPILITSQSGTGSCISLFWTFENVCKIA